jgi:hypothetical protein
MISYFNSTIDTIHGAQSKILSTVVTDEVYRKPLQTAIDAGSEFAKTIAKTAHEIADHVTNKVTKK